MPLLDGIKYYPKEEVSVVIYLTAARCVMFGRILRFLHNFSASSCVIVLRLLMQICRAPCIFCFAINMWLYAQGVFPMQNHTLYCFLITGSKLK